MNKVIEKIELMKTEKLEKERERLKSIYEEARDFYSYTGYDRYYKKMQKAESELEEIENYIHKNDVVVKDLSTEQYREYLKMKHDIKSIKNKLYYIQADFNLPVTADIQNLKDLLREYDE